MNGFGAYIWDEVGGWEFLTCWWVCTNIYMCFRCKGAGFDVRKLAVVVGISFRLNVPRDGAMQLC